MVYPAVVITFAMVVMLALVAFIVPVFAKVFKDFGGELPAHDEVHGRHVRLRDRPLVSVHRDRRRAGLGLLRLEEVRRGDGRSGTASGSASR